MKREIEKLHLTSNQYRTLGTFMMVFTILICIGAYFVSDYSIVLSIVLGLIGIETAFIGYVFRKVAGEIENSTNEQFLSKHRYSPESKRNRNTIVVFLVSIAIVCIISVGYCTDVKIEIRSKDSENVSSSQGTNSLMSGSNLSEVYSIGMQENDVQEVENQGDEQDYAQGNEEDNKSVVFATNTGKCYHYSQKCAGEKSFAITIQEAQRHSLTACKKCVK